MSHLAARFRLKREQTHTVGSRVSIWLAEFEERPVLTMVLLLPDRVLSGRSLEVTALSFD